MTEKIIDPSDYEMVSTRQFKLKDNPNDRRFQIVNLENFGEVPKIIAVEKVRGQNNKFVVKGFIKKKNDNK